MNARTMQRICLNILFTVHFLFIYNLGTDTTKKYLVAEYGNDNNKDPVIAKIGDQVYQLKFNILVSGDNYYYFAEDEKTRKEFCKKNTKVPEDSVMISSFDIPNKGTKAKLAIKLRIVHANFCPGSCIFLFWIYRVKSDGRIHIPDLFIYTGDCCLTAGIKKTLTHLRNENVVRSVTIVNDNTITDDGDFGFSNEKDAIKAMVDFIEEHKKQCNTSITVKIAADWGLEKMCKRLANEYDADLRFCDDVESALRKIKSEHFFCTIENTSKKEDGKKQDSNRKVMYVI